MKFSDIGLILDGKLSRNPAEVRFVMDFPARISVGTVVGKVGSVTLAWCGAGICYLGFEEKRTLEQVRKIFPDAEILRDNKKAAELVDRIVPLTQPSPPRGEGFSVIVRGTPFQKSVWEALLHIPKGHVVTYGTVAEYIGNPKATRAVGTAVGANPISLLIPCHRVIQSNGSLKNYGWGDAVKEKLLREEAHS